MYMKYVMEQEKEDNLIAKDGNDDDFVKIERKSLRL